MTATTRSVVSLLTFILVALFFVIGSTAVPAYQEGKVYRHLLPNGLTVLTMERHIAPLIYHQLTYKVGSRNERLGITGISHVVEHIMFKGTARYKKGEASKTISNNAGVFNAFTSNDMTSYFEYLPANKIQIAFDIESDRMQNCIFDSAEVRSEIEVIKQERRMRSESSPQGIMNETMNSVAYQSHPNRDPIIGWPGDLSRITRADAYTYYKTYYTPNNAVLVLVGDFDTEAMLGLAAKYYGVVPRGPEVPQVWAVEQPQKVRKSFTVYHNDVSSPSLRMAFHVPTYEDPDAAPLRIAGMILCERSRDARLYKRLVEKGKIAKVAAGGMGLGKDPGLFSISVSLVPDSSVDRSEALVWEEIARMQQEPVTDHELQKAKNRYRFNQVTEYVKNSDIGTRISRYETYVGWEFFEKFDKRMMSVTREDIQRVMGKYLNPNQVTVGILLPKTPGKREKPGAPQEQEESPDPGVIMNEGTDAFYYQQGNVEPEIWSQVDGNEFADIVRPKPIAPMVNSATLNNGIKVYIIENHLVPALFVGGFFENGKITEDLAGQGKPGIAALLSDLMNRGTATMTYEQLSERMAFVPFSFSVTGSYHGFSFQGYSLTRDAEEMLGTGVDILLHPGFRQEDIVTLKTRHTIAARERFKRTGVVAFYHMFNTLFRDHPYSQTNSTEESIRSIDKGDLMKLHEKYFRPERLTLVIMGDMTFEEMKAIAGRHFGGWKSTVPAPPVVSAPPVKDLAGREIRVFPEKDYAECTINIGFSPFNTIDPKDEEAVTLLNTILASSALTSRIGVELRDKQGLVYGIKSELWGPNDDIGYWKMNTKTGPKNTVRVIRGVFKEIRRLLNDGVTAEEVRDAKRRQLGLLPLLVETPDDIAGRVFDLLRDRKSLEWFDQRADRIRSATAEDLMRVAHKYFTLDKYVIVVDGPIEEGSLSGLVNDL